ncbi:MAG: ASKHA domain-containing protein [Faecousia sp.]
MGRLTIWQSGTSKTVSFAGAPLLQTVLTRAGYCVDHPCGGRGVCGKCAVKLLGNVSAPNEAEQKAGTRLSCQAVLLGDAEVWLEDTQQNRIEVSGQRSEIGKPMGLGIGAAVDIGTTTLVMELFDLKTGASLGTVARMNPQRSVAADVMGRIGAAMEGQGEFLKAQIQGAIARMRAEVCAAAGVSERSVDVMVVAGNTTMLYLLTGRNPECLSHAPFAADTLFGTEALLLNTRVYYPPCMNAFVGADITCAVLASGMYKSDQISLLCDIGTNGEIALWKEGHLFVTSTAAGPAFEGAGISCGCGSVNGAIDRVWAEKGEIHAHTIGDVPAVGICGSGLIDAVAAFLETEQIDETGACETDTLPLRDGIALLPKDIRAVQLAKAAIAAGIGTLLETAGVSEEEVTTLYIAGGFGSHLNVASAAAIGLIPKSLQGRVQVIGNGSLSGAAAVLLNQNQKTLAQKLAEESVHINLGGNPRFNANYMEQMLFGNGDLFG